MLDTQVNGVASLSGTFLFLTTVTVLLRFLARYKQKAYVSVDDYLIVCGWVRSISLWMHLSASLQSSPGYHCTSSDLGLTLVVHVDWVCRHCCPFVLR
jgi:hypothetical protein